MQQQFMRLLIRINQIPERISSKIDSIPILTDEIILSAMNKSNYSNFNTAKDFRMALDGLKKIQSNNPSEYFVENIIQPEDETIKLIKPTKILQELVIFYY